MPINEIVKPRRSEDFDQTSLQCRTRRDKLKSNHSLTNSNSQSCKLDQYCTRECYIPMYFSSKACSCYFTMHNPVTWDITFTTHVFSIRAKEIKKETKVGLIYLTASTGEYCAGLCKIIKNV